MCGGWRRIWKLLVPLLSVQLLKAAGQRRASQAVSDDLTVGGPGTTRVLTTSLVEEARRLSRLESEVEAWRWELASLDRIIGSGILAAADAPRSALLAERAIDDASLALQRARDDCSLLARGVASAAEGYEFAEQFVDRLNQGLAARLGYLVGSVAPLILAILLPGAAAAGALWLGVYAALPETSRARIRANLKDWFRENAAPLSDPGTVQAIRLAVMSADDAGWGLIGVPPEFATMFGDEGLGVFGVDTSAGVVAAAAAGAGLLRETPVRVRAVASTSGVPGVQGIRERVERIPNEPEQIRIDRYSSPGHADRFEVYIAGTAELGLSGDTEPWDMTSNVTALSGASAGSYRAVVEAMRHAGIDATSSVTLTGYSQGGLIAAQIAASGNYSVDGLLTLGAPAGQVSVPHDIPYLAIEHTNDLVPALGGSFASSEPVIVRRQLFDGPPPPSEFVLPAHRLSNYLETAELVDASHNLTIGETLARLDNPYSAEVVSTVYRAERFGG